MVVRVIREDPYRWVVKYRNPNSMWRRTRYRTFRTSWDASVFVDILVDAKEGYNISVYKLYEW